MENNSPESPSTSSGFKLFLLGFLTLFLELALIRYLSGNIWNLGYFPNFVLLAVFIGMGMGFVFHHYLSSKISSFVFQASFALLMLLVSFLYFERPSVPGFGKNGAEIAGELFFTATLGQNEHNYLPLIICFSAVILIFVFISQRTAKLFSLFKPLTAYSLDIAGSCAGILCFMLASWMELPAYSWFIIFTLLFPLVVSGSWKMRILPLLFGFIVVFFAFSQDSRPITIPSENGQFLVQWSPYQKVEMVGGAIFVNGVGHQVIYDKDRIMEVYYEIYRFRSKASDIAPYKSVLVLGSGSGNDVAAALFADVEHVDAVEIDPVIAQIGKDFHPCKPYQDPRVKLTVDDGRAFMNQTDRKYDLIVFALTDSLVRASSMAQLRLENYLFTEESVRKAYSLLNENGDIVFYNFYRRAWLVQKIMDMGYRATGKQPGFIIEPMSSKDLAVLNIRKTGKSDNAETARQVEYDIPTDDWPFLYIKNRGIPSLYLKVIIGMCLFVGLLVFIVHRSSKHLEQYGSREMLFIKLAFIFMGIAFMLLETKSVIQFSLLFGTTWLNNSLVFLAVLLLILAANLTALLIKGTGKLWLIYILLLGSSLSTLLYPLGNLLNLESSLIRFVLASLLTFSPIYFANLIFSITFREQEIAEHIFGWNLIGATIGGIAEYASMALGYNFLAIIVAISYTFVFIFLVKARQIQSRVGGPKLTRIIRGFSRKTGCNC